MHAPDLQERFESALIGKDRQDLQRTHSPSAVGSSRPPHQKHALNCGNVLCEVSERQLPSRGRNPLLASLGPGGSVSAGSCLTCMDASGR